MTTNQPPAPAGAGRGIAWMLVATVFFVGIDATGKRLVQELPVVQAVWGRYFFHALWVMALLGLQLPKALRATRRPALQGWRAFTMLATTVLFFTAVTRMPLVDVSSLMFLGPILITALSVPLLGEQVGPRRWAGVVIGFIGALVIVRPGAGVMDAFAGFAVAGALFNALYQISTRMLTRTDPVATTNLWSALLCALVLTAVVPFFWVAPTPAQWGLLLLVGFCGASGHFALIKAFSAAPPVVVVPFSYATLLWSSTVGFIVFDELPDLWTLVGAAILISSGVYIFFRERSAKSSSG